MIASGKFRSPRGRTNHCTSYAWLICTKRCVAALLDAVSAWWIGGIGSWGHLSRRVEAPASLAGMVAASGASRLDAQSKLGRVRSPTSSDRTRGRRTAARWLPSKSWVGACRRESRGAQHPARLLNPRREPTGLLQRGQQLLSRADAQVQEGVAHIAQCALHGQS